MENFNIKQYHWIKDKNFKYTNCSEGFAFLAGVDSPLSLIGKTDFDLIWTDKADLYLKEDQIVFDGSAYQGNQIQRTSSGIIKIIVSKSPLYNRNGKIIGTIGSSIDVSHIAKKSNNKNIEKLTSKQLIILKYVAIGYSSKRIANILHRSHRTVESHIETLKYKFQCHNKNDLINLAIDLGVINITFCV